MSKAITKITDSVMVRVKELESKKEIAFPEKYSVENALQSAYLIMQKIQTKDHKPVLEVCTKASIAECLLDMVIQGLSPAKKQCYFIAYGKELTMQRSYFGTVAVLKRLTGVKSIVAQVVHEGEKFEIGVDESGSITVKEHAPTFETLDNDFSGAYCVVTYENGTKYTEVMTRKMILQAWRQSKMNVVNDNGSIKSNSVHGKFTDEMVKKTVINRAAKLAINSSDDSDLMIESINGTTENEYKPADDSDIIDMPVNPKKIEKQEAEKVSKERDYPDFDAKTQPKPQPQPQPQEERADTINNHSTEQAEMPWEQ